MNNWKEHPNLFVRNFRVRYGEQSCALIGVSPDGLNLMIIKEDAISDSGSYVACGICTLIARPISDMTDEEVKKSSVIKQLRDNPDIASHYDLNVQEFLYLLSIGVYPFSQSHFETGEVLNINEI